MSYYTFYAKISSGQIEKNEVLRGAKKCKRPLKNIGKTYQKASGFICWWGGISPHSPSSLANVSGFDVPVFGYIYMLVRKRTVVYIGETFNVRDRILGHSKKDFDKVYFLPCIFSNRKELERMLIQKLKPIHNKQHNPRYK